MKKAWLASITLLFVLFASLHAVASAANIAVPFSLECSGPPTLTASATVTWTVNGKSIVTLVPITCTDSNTVIGSVTVPNNPSPPPNHANDVSVTLQVNDPFLGSNTCSGSDIFNVDVVPPDTPGLLVPCPLSPQGATFTLGVISPKEPVGGEFLPIDNTALMLAGLQSSAIWMLPVLAGAAGAGFAAFKLRRK